MIQIGTTLEWTPTVIGQPPAVYRAMALLEWLLRRGYFQRFRSRPGSAPDRSSGTASSGLLLPPWVNGTRADP